MQQDSTPLEPDALVLGLDVGGTTIKAEITDAAGAVLASGAVATPHGEAAFDAMLELGDKLLAELPPADRPRVARAAVLLPGVVDTAASIAVFSANIGWRDVRVGPRFTDRWSMPVLLEHDVTAAGWAEWRFGAGRAHDTVLVVVIGTGISGTLSVNGGFVRGALGQAGEYGHIPVRKNGLPCPCGNTGCVETLASAPAITRAHARRTGHEYPSAADIFARLPDDPAARAVVTDAVEALADGLIGIVHAVCPELIVLGGGLAGAGEALAHPLHQALTTRLRLVPAPAVVIGTFGARAGLTGSALLARHGALI
ncbi:ROK family protein [Nocardia crassostreae]|uniref:ROK family protein n=1 Tax=Nocardia crassostreae TaxID=53428 RepID=UPI0009FC7AE1|nr:ROK family protein [Nocardia crassostreae]